MISAIRTFLSDTFVRPSGAQFTPSGRPREGYVDLAKGICIFLVLVHHCGVFVDPNFGGLRCMRMPLYFFLSGLFYRDYSNGAVFALKKTMSLLVPLMFFLLFGGVVNSFVEIHKGEPVTLLSTYSWLIYPGSFMRSNPALWFLVTLFEVNVMYRFLRGISHNRWWLAFSALLLGFVGVVFSGDVCYHKVWLPYWGTQALLAFPFYFFGAEVSRHGLLARGMSRRSDLLVGASLLLAACGVAVAADIDIDIHTMLIGANPLLSYLVATTMIVGVMLLSRGLQWLPFISYIGRYSLIVLGTHIVFLNVAECFLGGYPAGEGLPNFFVTILLSWLSIPLFTSMFPWFTAQRDILALPRFRRLARVPD